MLLPLYVLADTVILDNGDQLQGVIITQTNETLTLNHPVLGELTIPMDKVTTLNLENVSDAPAKADSPEQTLAAADTATSTETDKGFLHSGWLMGWKRQLAVAIDGAAGKSENSKINIGFTADYEDKKIRWAHETKYYRNESEGVLSDHSLTASLNRDWLLPKSTRFYFAGGHIDFDEFKDWDERIAVNAGIGNEFINTDTWRLIGKAGLGVNQTFGGIREETTLEGLLEAQVNWKISNDQSVAFNNKLYPNFSDSGEFRNVSSLDWVLALEETYDLGLKVGLDNEYDSLSSESDKNDFKYSVSILLGL
ncbi:MAG: DUF481 domain-containing protein [Gammaproteobacteria bacterium]